MSVCREWRTPPVDGPPNDAEPNPGPPPPPPDPNAATPPNPGPPPPPPNAATGPNPEPPDGAPSPDEPPRRYGAPPFPMVHVRDIGPSLDACDFVEDLLTEGGMSICYGRSNVGKSFFALDLAAHVAGGRTWRDSAVKGGAVIYVALEGEKGLRNRLTAMRSAGRVTDDDELFLVFEPVLILDEYHVDRLVETVLTVCDRCSGPVRMVVIDTLSRTMAGGDENSSQDMTYAIAGVDEVRRKTGAHVMLVHHCGKDEARGTRGHSSLRAASDTEIELHRPADDPTVTASVTKQKDLPFAGPYPFSLQVMELGRNERGKPVTSCVVKHEAESMATIRSAGRPPSVKLGELLDLLPQDSTKDWKAAANDDLGVSESAFYRYLKKLRGNGALKKPGGGWVRADT